MQRQARVERAFEAIEREYILGELVLARIDMPSANTLFGRYSAKISQNLRNVAIPRIWNLGPTGPPGKLATWEVVAGCIGQELDRRIDAWQPRESAHTAIGLSSANSSVTCW